VLKKAYKTVYRSGLELEDAVKQLESSAEKYIEVESFVSFIAGSERGIIR